MNVTSSGRFIKPFYAKGIAVVRIMDSVTILASLWLAIALLDYLMGAQVAWDEVVWNSSHTAYAFAGILLYQFFADYFGIYQGARGETIHKELRLLLWSWICAIVAVMGIGLLWQHGNYIALLTVGTWLPVSSALFLIVRGVGYVCLGYLRSQSYYSRRIAVAGATDLGARTVRALASMPWLGYCFQGYYDDRMPLRGLKPNIRDSDIVGTLGDLVRHAQEGKIDEIFVTFPMRAENRIIDLINRLADTTARVYYLPDVFVFNLVCSRLDTIQGLPCITIYGSPFAREPLDGFLKRMEDIILSMVILSIIALPMLCIAVAVRLESPGPAIFRQKRYGIRGDAIEVWKFRTMTVQEDNDCIKQARRGDSRVTRFGAFLRRSSLDELPQFINVLQGTMSIVGPRPHAIAHNEYYRSRINGYMLRHAIKPGITGLAQVNGCRGETDTLDKMERRIFLDLEYIRNWGLLLDLKIIFLTIFKVVNDPAAY